MKLIPIETKIQLEPNVQAITKIPGESTFIKKVEVKLEKLNLPNLNIKNCSYSKELILFSGVTQFISNY